MEALVVRSELPIESATLLYNVAVSFDAEVQRKLTGIVPQHTRAKLEEQAETIGHAIRELERAIANPDAVEAPDPAES